MKKKCCSALQWVEGLSQFPLIFNSSIQLLPSQEREGERENNNQLSLSHADRGKCCLLFHLRNLRDESADFSKSAHFTRTLQSSCHRRRSVGQQSEVGDNSPGNGCVLSYLPHIDKFKSEEEAQVDLLTRWDEPLLSKTSVCRSEPFTKRSSLFWLLHCAKSNSSVFVLSCLENNCQPRSIKVQKRARKVLFRAPERLATWKQLWQNSVMFGTTRSVLKQQQEQQRCQQEPPLTVHLAPTQVCKLFR